MKVYQAADDQGDGPYFLTQREAMAEARRRRDAGEGDIEIIRLVVKTNKEGILALVNQRGWASEQTVVGTIKATKAKPKEQVA